MVNSKQGEESVHTEDNNESVTEKAVSLFVSPGEHEKSASMAATFEMRNDASFCDVAFLVQGCLFRAHKVIVRWLFALLSEGPDQEIISLDVFTPAEFGAVLDYMYGKEIEVTVDNAEAMLKVIRRMELQALEQKCWRFLLSIVDSSNCQHLHNIADFFDCAPLKLAAWRIIQESRPGYSAAPTELLQSMNALVGRGNGVWCGHGLIGPGETVDSSVARGDESDDEDGDGAVSIFTSATPNGGEEGLLASSSRRYNHFVRPDQLPRGTPAAEVVRAWAFRLQEVYNECCQDGLIVDPAYDTEAHQDINAHGRGRSGTGTLSEHSQDDEHNSRASQRRDDPPQIDRMLSKGSLRSESLASTHSSPGKRQPGLSQMQQSQSARLKAREAATSHVIYEGSEEGNESVQSRPRNDSGIDWREELSNFYISMNMHDKLENVDTILVAWAGKEKEMMEVLHDKYNVPIPQELSEKLERVA